MVFLLILFYSLTPQSIDNELTKSKLIDTVIINWNLDYYSDDYRDYNDDGFTIRPKKKEYRHSSYQCNFYPENKLVVKNISNIPSCGNGVLSIYKATWHMENDSTIVISQDGEYALDNTFSSKIRYTIIPLENDNYFLKRDSTLNFINHGRPF